jgi:hypothetical protein
MRLQSKALFQSFQGIQPNIGTSGLNFLIMLVFKTSDLGHPLLGQFMPNPKQTEVLYEVLECWHSNKLQAPKRFKHRLNGSVLTFD